MPFSRYQIRNEYSLADPELYKTADKDDPEALLEGVAMAGLVGVLRQLGDLAEFAAEIFHGLHEEVMVTAARGHGLLVRVQQLESDFPSIERAFLSQTGHSAFFSSSGISWHPNLQTEQNLITRGDLPRFVMDSYEECRGPPRLFLLDKFDVAGAGACLKRYTDPSFYKVEASSYEMTSAETQRDKKIRKTKKKGSRWKNGGTPEVSQPSHVKLHQLLLEERMQNGASEPAGRVKLKKRKNKFPFNTEEGKGYMEKLLSSPSEDKLVHEVPFDSSPLRLPTNNSGGSGFEIIEVSMVTSPLGSPRQNRSPYESPSVDKMVSREHIDNMPENEAERLGGVSSELQEEVEEKHISVDGERKTDGYQSDDAASETENYVDALTTMESENETDAEVRANSDPSIKLKTYSDGNVEQHQSQSSDSQSSSDGGSSSIGKEATSDTTSTSPGEINSNQAFACTEIPFHPRVSPVDCIEVRGDISATGSALPVDQEAIFKESTSTESDLNEMSSNNSVDLNSPKKREKNEIDPEAIMASVSKLSEVHSPTTDDPSSSSFARNPDNEDISFNTSPVIHLPNVLDTTCGVEESSSSKDNKDDSVDSTCSSPHSANSHVEEQLFSRSVDDLDMCDPDVKPSETSSSGDNHVAEEKIFSPESCYLPEGQSNDDVLVSISDLVSYSSDDETELKEREAQSVDSETNDATGSLSDRADVYKNGDHGLSTLEDEREIEQRDTESVNAETKAVTAAVSVPENVDSIESKGLSVDSETEDATFSDVEKNEFDGVSTSEEPRENGSVIGEPFVVQTSDKSGEKKDLNEESVIEPELPSASCNTVSYDHLDIELLDRIPANSNDADNPSADMKISQDQSQFGFGKTDQNGPQTDVDSRPGDHQSNAQFLDSAPNSPVSTEAQTGLPLDNTTAVFSSPECIEEDVESKSVNPGDQIDKLEAASYISSHSVPIDEKVDQHVDLNNHLDHETPFDTPSEPSPPNREIKSLERHEEFQGDVESSTLDVSEPSPPNHEIISLEPHKEFQGDSESTISDVITSGSILQQSVPVSQELSISDLRQSNSHVDLSDQVEYPSAPVFSAFGMLPQLAPINLEEAPPLPPLPPMQWRMGKLSDAPLTSSPDGGQHSIDHFPPIFPQITTHPSLDVNENNEDTANQISKQDFEDEERGVLPSESSSFKLKDENTVISSEVNAVKSIFEREQSRNVSTSGREIIRPSSTSSLPVVDDERPNGIRPMKVQRSRTPLIDAVAAHDKSKLRKVSERARSETPKEEGKETLLQLRKVSERARSQVPKEEERDTLLEQIRAKSFNLKPAVQTRPSIQGPSTNLRVAAILEKANAIRQAFAGSDDDEDDDDSWSDS